MAEQTTYYDAVGGRATFARITEVFYQQVAADAEMRPLYPEEDLGPAEERLRMFLEQYWGGPTTYHETRGHPRLRMRHAPFAVTPRLRDRWVAHMRVALDDVALPPELEEPLWDYLQRAASFMVNSPDEDGSDDAGPPTPSPFQPSPSQPGPGTPVALPSVSPPPAPPPSPTRNETR